MRGVIDPISSRARRAGDVVDRWYPIKRLLHWAHHAVVVGQHALGTDEETIAASQFKVEDKLDLLGLYEPPRNLRNSEVTVMMSLTVRSRSPDLRSRAITQPTPAFQKRCMPVATIDSPPRSMR